MSDCRKHLEKVILGQFLFSVNINAVLNSGIKLWLNIFQFCF